MALHLKQFMRLAELCFLIIIAALSGYSGGIVAQIYQTSDEGRSRPFIIEQANLKKSEYSVDDLFKHIQPMTVSLIGKGSKEWITSHDLTSYGTILTSDGWIVTSLPLEGHHDIERAIRSDGTALRILERKDDPALHIQFLRVDASGLQPIDFLRDDEHHEALKAYAYIPHVGMQQLMLVRRWYLFADDHVQQIQSSDRLEKIYPYDISLGTSGAPIFSEQGRFAGIIGASGIIPSLYIQNGLKKLLKTGEIKRIALHIPYVDLALTDSLNTSIHNGAKIVSDKPIGLMTKYGTSQLNAGDIITKVNDEDINENQSLSELLADYALDDDIALTVQRVKGGKDILPLQFK